MKANEENLPHPGLQLAVRVLNRWLAHGHEAKSVAVSEHSLPDQ
jgi:hypothetical protein